MAGHSQFASGFQQRIPASIHRREGQRSLEREEGWDESDIPSSQALGVETEERRSWETTNFEEHYNATQRSSTSMIITSHRPFMDAAPVPPHTPLRSESRTTSSKSSLELDHTSPNLLFEENDDLFGPAGMHVLPTEVERPPSPCNQMSYFRAENQNLHMLQHAGPLDRFIAQDDHFTDFDDNPERREEEWKRLRMLRVSVLRHRAELRKKRDVLQRKQSEKDSADEAFMKYVRENRYVAPSYSQSASRTLTDPKLETYFAAMQAARDEYGPLEFEYNELEDQLDEEEFELAIIEGRVYKLMFQDIRDSQSSVLPFDKRLPPAPESFLGLASHGEDGYHPFHMNYLSSLGDLDLARERHHNLIEERNIIILQQETRSTVGIALEDGAKEFLDEFPAKEAALVAEMTKLEEDIESWRIKCLDNGINIDEGDSEVYQGTEKVEENIMLEHRSTGHMRKLNMSHEIEYVSYFSWTRKGKH
jgi:hypothetical protein